MKAIIYERYGPPDVVSVRDVARPVPKPREVLVRVMASSVTTADWRLRAAAFPGFTWLPGRLMFGICRPRRKILGGEFSGVVEEVGAEVRDFRVGDPVFGFAGQGAHAEFLTIGEDAAITAKPPGISHQQAAAIPFGGLAALVFLRDFGQIEPGERVLVVGASGGVGAWAVQVARHLGAKVTGVASAGHTEMVRSLGAESVIDYRQGDYLDGGNSYDVVLDTIGATTFSAARRVLDRDGRYLPLNITLADLVAALLRPLRGGPRVVPGVNGDRKEDLEYLAAHVASGDLRPVIDTVYPLAEIRDAYARVETRHRRGSIVLAVGEPAMTVADVGFSTQVPQIGADGETRMG